MNSIEVALAMLLAVVGSGYLVRMLPFSLPLPLVQIALGAVIAGVFNHGVTLDPEIFLLLFLPPLLPPDGTPFPARELAIFLATTVILVSLLAASIGLPHLLKGLQLPSQPAEQQEENLALRHAGTAAIAAVEKSRHDLLENTPASEVDICTSAATRVITLYRHWLDEDASGEVEAKQLRKADAAERELRLAALQGQREAIFELALHYRISDDVSRRLVREIDLQEARYR